MATCLSNLLDKHEHTTGFAVMEESGLRIGTSGTLKDVNVMILNDMFASVRNIIDFTNELFNQPINEMANEQKQETSPQLDDLDEDDDDQDIDDQDEEEEEFKICLQTKTKQRLVLCTIEGVCCAMHQHVQG